MDGSSTVMRPHSPAAGSSCYGLPARPDRHLPLVQPETNPALWARLSLQAAVLGHAAASAA